MERLGRARRVRAGTTCRRRAWDRQREVVPAGTADLSRCGGAHAAGGEGAHTELNGGGRRRSARRSRRPASPPRCPTDRRSYSEFAEPRAGGRQPDRLAGATDAVAGRWARSRAPRPVRPHRVGIAGPSHLACHPPSKSRLPRLNQLSFLLYLFDLLLDVKSRENSQSLAVTAQTDYRVMVDEIECMKFMTSTMASEPYCDDGAVAQHLGLAEMAMEGMTEMSSPPCEPSAMPLPSQA